MRERCTPCAARRTTRPGSPSCRPGTRWAAARLAALSKIKTGIAAHLDDPLLRENVRLDIALAELSDVTSVATRSPERGNKLRIHDETCVKPRPARPRAAWWAPTAPPSIDAGAACNSVTKNLSFVIDPSKLLDGIEGAKELPKLPKLKVSCERLQLSYEFGKSAWVQPFVQVDWKFKAGTRDRVRRRARQDRVHRPQRQAQGRPVPHRLQDTVSRTSAGARRPASRRRSVAVLEVSAKQDGRLVRPGVQGPRSARRHRVTRWIQAIGSEAFRVVARLTMLIRTTLLTSCRLPAMPMRSGMNTQHQQGPPRRCRRARRRRRPVRREHRFCSAGQDATASARLGPRRPRRRSRPPLPPTPRRRPPRRPRPSPPSTPSAATSSTTSATSRPSTCTSRPSRPRRPATRRRRSRRSPRRRRSAARSPSRAAS